MCDSTDVHTKHLTRLFFTRARFFQLVSSALKFSVHIIYVSNKMRVTIPAHETSSSENYCFARPFIRIVSRVSRRHSPFLSFIDLTNCLIAKNNLQMKAVYEPCVTVPIHTDHLPRLFSRSVCLCMREARDFFSSQESFDLLSDYASYIVAVLR